MTRTRTRVIPLPGGGKVFRQLFGSVIIDGTQEPSYTFGITRQECIDVVNRRDQDNPLTITKEWRRFDPLDGIYGEKGSWIGWREFTKAYATTVYTSYPHHTELPSQIPSIDEVAIMTLSRSNPSRPYISLPTFIYELKDLPSMIRDIGRLRIQGRNAASKGLQRIHPKVAANHYLSYEMGWKPLLSDLRKLLDFQAQVDKKMRELENLYNKGGLQRRVRLPNWKASATGERVVILDTVTGLVFTANRQEYHSIERWGTVRWYPSSRPDKRYSQAELAKLARDLTFGIKGISPKQVWDAIPWTWLIGWFANVDDFLQAHDNRIPLTHSTPCVMTKSFMRLDFTRIPGEAPGITGGSGYYTRETKERTTSEGSLSATIPFLNGRQLSILSALHLQRRR